MRYTGIDPSTKTGIVTLDDDGKIITAKEIKPTEDNDPWRFIEIARNVLDELVWAETFVCIEGFSYGSRGKGVSIQYGIGWIIRAELAKKGFGYEEISPNTLKKFATGKGNAKKDAMVLPIFKHWGFEHSSDNVRDAYILAQIARALNGQGKLTKYQQEAIKKIAG